MLHSRRCLCFFLPCITESRITVTEQFHIKIFKLKAVETFHVIWRLFKSQSDCADIQAQKEQMEQN